MDRRVQSRLKAEAVIWLVTADRQARPQAVPVWFHWNGDSFLIFAQAGAKVRHVRENPHVELHLNTDEAGDVVARISGRAAVLKSSPAARREAYLRKYRRHIRDLGLSIDVFASKYRFPIHVTRLRYH